MPKCGSLPTDMGLIDISPKEMMFWMYCPIKHPGFLGVSLPDNLKQFIDIILAARSDVGEERWERSYVYLTAKTLWVSGDYIGNRPGWHSDGFGTDDLNYIWADRAPTEFVVGEWSFTNDHEKSLEEMENAAAACIPIAFPDKHLLRLDPSVIHRSPVGFAPGMRTFVKVSISDNEYNLEGNSVNHLLPTFELKPREEQRNHPTK